MVAEVALQVFDAFILGREMAEGLQLLLEIEPRNKLAAEASRVDGGVLKVSKEDPTPPIR